MKDTGTELIAELSGVEVFRYVYRPDTPVSESPKPYFHPIRTLASDVVTAYRPHDHRWHKGIQMTVSHLSGENFWGGGSYVHPDGYVDLPNNGTMRHTGFSALGPDGFTETLAWHTQAGEHWVDERREIAVRQLDASAWLMSFHTDIRNVHTGALRFGSPTTHGRPMAGYSGLFWRGPRAFTDGEVLADADRSGPRLMGEQSAWLAYAGRHDEVDRCSTLLFVAAPGTTWFVRTTPFPAVNPSLAFFEEVTLAPDETLSLAYRIVVADGAWDRERIESCLAELP
ncbi:PmoA family protein [Micromonospora sp. URMC 106]|uniref:DUF6807 domain-containing protein n=1 Tax=Micromonospora sp. URMC 106 TaxID=3423408 RepID=UPI003F1D8EBF